MFTIRFQDNDTFRICLQAEDTFHVCFGEITKVTEVDWYEGPYEVIPSAHEAKVLETQGLAMQDDVTVIKIPYFETANLFDGRTAYIANEV